MYPGLIAFVIDASLKNPRLIHLSVHTIIELPACSKHAQKMAHRTAKIKIAPNFPALAEFPFFTS